MSNPLKLDCVQKQQFKDIVELLVETIQASNWADRAANIIIIKERLDALD